jgi:NADPH:quinone reductase-like Zn-dependent oxidoreductase
MSAPHSSAADEYLAIVTTEARGVYEHKVKKSQHGPQPNEIVAEVAFAGLNHIDVNQAETGAYIQAFPFILGKEWSGKVVELGSDVKDLKVGDAVSQHTIWRLDPKVLISVIR